MVIYQAMYGDGGTWARSLSMWENLIEVDGNIVKRFEYVGGSNESGNKDELLQVHRALLSTLQKCEKMDINKLGKSQQTLHERRIYALKIALALIEKESESLA